MSLNKRDLHYYYMLLNQIKMETKVRSFDEKWAIVVKFILGKYNSDDFETYCLEDFIQDCYIYILTNDDVIDENSISSLYNKLKNEEQNQLIKETINDDDYYITDFENGEIVNQIYKSRKKVLN